MGAKLFFLKLLFILLTISVIALADLNYDKKGDDPKVSEEELNKFMDETGIEGLTADNVQKQGDNLVISSGPFKKNGASINGKNIVVDDDGNIVEAEALNVDGNTFQNVEGFQRLGDGEYKVKYAELLQDGNRKVVEGKVITGQKDKMEAEEADSVMNENAIVTQAEDYVSTGNSVNVGKAKTVFINQTRFDDIKESSFTTENSDLIKADITSAVDNNSFEIDDIKVSLNKDDTVEIVKNQTTGKYNIKTKPESAEGMDIEDSGGNVACADISAGSRYRYVDDEFDPFGVYIPSYAFDFKLCIGTSADEDHSTDCWQCGVVDFYNRKFYLNGIYEYEKQNEMGMFVDVIKSTAYTG